jgi:hypothetical protein
MTPPLPPFPRHRHRSLLSRRERPDRQMGRRLKSNLSYRHLYHLLRQRALGT